MDINKIRNDYFQPDTPESIALRKQCTDALDKILGIGLNILDWERIDTNYNPNETGIVLTFYRRILEMIDACSILLEFGSVTPCISNSRIILESFYQLEYLIKDPKEIGKKGLHIMITDLDRELNHYKKLKNYPKIIELMPDIDDYIDNLQKQINDNIFKPIIDDYKSMFFKNEVRKAKDYKWYYLSSNENSVANLAKNVLKRELDHDILYSAASNVSHSSRLIGETLDHEDQAMYLKPLRNQSEIITVTYSIINLSKMTYQIMMPRRSKEQKIEYFDAVKQFDSIVKIHAVE